MLTERDVILESDVFDDAVVQKTDSESDWMNAWS